MNRTPPPIVFRCHCPGGFRAPDQSLLDAPLQLSRQASGSTDSGEVTYGTYLHAVALMLEERWNDLLPIIGRTPGKAGGELQRIEIIPEKHGSDYHPARIRAVTDGGIRQFVANVAVTHRGRERIDREFRMLRRLREEFTEEFIPQVHFLASTPDGVDLGEGDGLVMFLADWMEGYHEFHLCAAAEGDAPTTVLWDEERGRLSLTRAQAREIFRCAAHILTYYYGVDTSVEIFPWHHAAGDFVAAHNRGNMDVKLISVRQYESRMGFPEDSSDSRLAALFHFFANLTIRMRLDRLDGVGEPAWADIHCVQGTVDGFLTGLMSQVKEGRCPESFCSDFVRAAKEMSPAGLAEVFRSEVDSYDGNAPDLPLVERHLADHVFQVYKLLQHFPDLR